MKIYSVVIKIVSSLPREWKVEAALGAVNSAGFPILMLRPHFSTFPKIIFCSTALSLHSLRRGVFVSVWTIEERFCEGKYSFPLSHKGYFHVHIQIPALISQELCDHQRMLSSLI